MNLKKRNKNSTVLWAGPNGCRVKSAKLLIAFAMNERNYFIGVAIIVIAILAGAAIISLRPFSATAPVIDTTNQGTNTPSEHTETPVTGTKDTLYENGSLKITIPEGWTATPAAGATAKDALNIEKGNWILYVSPHASQASGVEGGRFAEIAMGAPSVDAVVTEQPSECGTTTKSAAFGTYSRVDYYMSNADKKDWCNAPTNGKTVWFFSYLTSPKNGFFNHYATDGNDALVVTMAYDSKSVNALPVKGSAELTAALKEMTDIAKTLTVK
jgi:hypothetical protein